MTLWVEFLRLSAGLVLLPSFAAKLLEGPKAFSRSIEQYDVLRGRAPTSLAYFALLVEGACGIGLLIGEAVSVFLAIAGLLFLSFGALGFATIRRRQSSIAVDCGCLGRRIPLRLDAFLVGKNVVAGTVCVLGAWVGPRVGAPTARSTNVPAAVLVACAALVAGIYWLSSYADSVIGSIQDALDVGES